MNFVSGGTGFIGSHVIRELLKNNEKVLAMKRVNAVVPDDLSKVATEKLTWIDADLFSLHEYNSELSKCRTIYHCAAIVSLVNSEREKMMRVNVDGTRVMVDLALENNIKNFVFVSSIAALGETLNENDLINEKTEWKFHKNKSAYSISKYLSENEVWRGKAEGLNVIVVNPSLVIGPSHIWYKGTAAMFKQAKKGLSYYPTGVNGWVDVRDVAKAMVQLCTEEKWGAKYLLNAENKSYQEVLSEMCVHLNPNQLPSKKFDGFVLELALVLDFIRASLRGKKRRIMRSTMNTANSVKLYDGSRIVKESDFQYKFVSDTIKETCEAYQRDND